MKKINMNKIKKLLEDERISIIEKLKLSSAVDIDMDGDETDEIQAKIIAHAAAQIASRNKEKMIRIENALKKLADGTFGYCEECGDEIAEKRLLVNPGFVTCISCAEHIEIMSKKVGR